MNYSDEHGILSAFPPIIVGETDTITLKKQVELKTLTEILCVNKETINYLNPGYKKDIYPKGAILVLPMFAINDFLENEKANYTFIEAVENKEILIDEDRIVYTVHKGDYLGRIAKEHRVKMYEIKKWNNLRTTNLDVGDKLVIYVKKYQEEQIGSDKLAENEYIIQKGDTLWGIAEKHEGLSVWKIRSLNNLESDNLKPGTKIILPTT
jgi:membrane-bound lytic murein transglycosylase D